MQRNLGQTTVSSAAFNETKAVITLYRAKNRIDYPLSRSIDIAGGEIKNNKLKIVSQKRINCDCNNSVIRSIRGKKDA